MEAHGGSWGPVAGKVFAELAQTKSLLTGKPQDHLLGQLYQKKTRIPFFEPDALLMIFVIAISMLIVFQLS